MGLASFQLRGEQLRDRAPGQVGPPAGRNADDLTAELSSALALCIAYGVALFLVLDALVVAMRGHVEATESTVFVLAFVGVLPVAVALAWLRAGHPGRRLALEPLAAGCLATAALGVLLQRLLNGAPLAAGRVALAAVVASLLALSLWHGESAARAGDWLRVPRARIVTLASLAVGLLAAAPGAMFDVGVVGQAVVAALVVAGVYRLTRARRLPRAAALAIDVVFVLFLCLALTNLDYGDPNLLAHGAYYLGPVNAVLHGRAVLVDTISQYGVGVIYFLAGIFAVVPLRLGPFMLLVSAFTAAQFAVSYLTMRAAWVARGIAIGTVGLAAVCTAGFTLPTPNASPLRFGPPYVLVALSVLALRGGRLRRPADLGMFVTLGISSLWSIEAFGCSAAAFLATELARSGAEPDRWRQCARRFLERLALGAVVVLVSQLVFALATRLFSGQWPDWNSYLQLEAVFTVHQYGDLPIARWSPGFLLAGLYMASGAAVAIVLLRRRPIDERTLPGLVASAGYAAFGAAMFSYFVGRSHPFVLWDVAPPGIILLGLWLGVLNLLGARLRALTLTATVAFAGALGLILFQLRTPIVPVIKNYSVLSTLAGESAPGVSLASSLKVIWKSPPTDPVVTDADVMTYLFARSTGLPTAVLIPAGEGPEVMLNIQRANALPIAYGIQDFLVKRWVEKIFRGALKLRPGTIVIVPQAWWDLPKPPPIPPLRSAPAANFPVFAVLNEIADAQQARLAILIRGHYRVQVIARSPHGLLVLRLGLPLTESAPAR